MGTESFRERVRARKSTRQLFRFPSRILRVERTRDGGDPSTNGTLLPVADVREDAHAASRGREYVIPRR